MNAQQAACSRDQVLHIGSFNIKGDCLASESFHKNLHTSPQAKHQVKSRLFLDVVIGKSTLPE